MNLLKIEYAGLGSGIPSDDLPHEFELLDRVEEERADRVWDSKSFAVSRNCTAVTWRLTVDPLPEPLSR